MSDGHPSQLPMGEIPDVSAPIRLELKDGAITPPGEYHSLLDDSGAATPFSAPNPPFMTSNRDSLASYVNSDRSGANSILLHPSSSASPLNPYNPYLEPKDGVRSNGAYLGAPSKRRPRRRTLLWGAVVLVLVVLAVVLGVFFGVVHHSKAAGNASGSPANSSNPSPSKTPPKPNGSAVVYGGDGTVVTVEDGTTFVYNNSFGGYFAVDPSDPFNNNARAQSWSPPLNQTWRWGTDIVRGVNLGGWLVMEPFITPALYQKYAAAVDEWTLSTAMAADPASGGLNQLEDHYKTFVTEQDFAEIAGAGLNWVRLPIPYWAIDTWPGEPFLPKVCWKYALKAFAWGRKYGIRILLDLHSTPGSQNGYNHSGQVGKVNLLNGVMGTANAQRLLHYIRIFTEFISQPEYSPVVQMFGIVNEPTGMPVQPLGAFYLEAYKMIRSISGYGAGNGPYISIQGGGKDAFDTFLPGADRLAVEQHPYFAFDGKGSPDVAPYISQPCIGWKDLMNSSSSTFGVATAGEWSLAFNDCGLKLINAQDTHTTPASVCKTWDAWEDYTPAMKQNLMSFTLSNMDALQNWFFWTWKVGPSAIDNSPRSPMWSYQLGLRNGWIPTDPRQAIGHCASLGVVQDTPFDGTFKPWQTGKASTYAIDPTDVAAYGQWPPASIGLVANAALLPTYTATGAVPTLSTQTFPSTVSVDGGNGWFDPSDTAPGITTVAGCAYPNAWDATAVPVPAALCTGAPGKREPAPAPIITPLR